MDAKFPGEPTVYPIKKLLTGRDFLFQSIKWMCVIQNSKLASSHWNFNFQASKTIYYLVCPGDSCPLNVGSQNKRNNK